MDSEHHPLHPLTHPRPHHGLTESGIHSKCGLSAQVYKGLYPSIQSQQPISSLLYQLKHQRLIIMTLFYDPATGCVSHPRHTRKVGGAAACLECAGRAEHKYNCPVSPFDAVRIDNNPRQAPRLCVNKDLTGSVAANDAGNQFLYVSP